MASACAQISREASRDARIGGSEGTACAFIRKPRMSVNSPLAMGPEARSSASVKAASTKKVLISMLFATSPRSIA